VQLEVADKLEPEGGDKFKRVVSKVDAPHDKTGTAAAALKERIKR
jgi:hypothetical protein